MQVERRAAREVHPTTPVGRRNQELVAPDDIEVKMRPLLRWAGGKSWLAKARPELINLPHASYIEPFLGGGSLFLAARRKRAYLSDVNTHLMQFYMQVAQSPAAVWHSYQQQVVGHSADRYLAVRARKGSSPVEEAARFLYLNRSCFNGLYRVNKQGQFNVPIGTPRFAELSEESFNAVAGALATADLSACDFGVAVEKAGEGDLLVLDPPYTVAHNQNRFIRYNEKIFSWRDQIRLASMAERAVRRGATVVATNANHAKVAALYSPRWFKLSRVNRRSAIAANASLRGSYSELLIESS